MRRGFTLVEMLTVIAIMALLMALLFPLFSIAREKARQNSCLTNLKQIGTALTSYAQDYDEVNVLSVNCELSLTLGVPYIYAHLLLPYTHSSIVYACGSHPLVPTLGNPNLGIPNLQVSYAINANNDDALGCPPSPSRTLRCTDGAGNPRPCKGFAGICRVRIAQPENLLALMEAPTENISADPSNPLIPPNGWRIYDPTVDPTPLGCWLQALPADCWTNQPVLYPAGERHTGGSNFLFADGHATWIGLLTVPSRAKVAE